MTGGGEGEMGRGGDGERGRWGDGEMEGIVVGWVEERNPKSN